MGVSFNDITNLANVMSASGARQQASNDATARTGLARDQLGLAKRAQGHAENQDVIQQARKSRAEIMKQISDVVATGVMDTNPDQGRQLIQKYGKTLAGLYTAGSGDPQESQKRAAIDVQAALARPNMMQSADLAGRTQGAQTNATDAAIGAPGATGRGREADIASTQAATSNAAANAARTRQATDQEAGAVINLLNRETMDEIAIRLNAPGAQQRIDRALASGFVEMGKPTLQAATSSDLTKSTQTNLQGDQVNAVEALNSLDAVVSGQEGTPEAVGVAGNIIETVQNNLLAQVFDDAFNPEVSEVRENIRIARETLLRDISDDDRFNKDDRKMITAALPETGIFESAQEAKSKSRMVAALIARRLAATAELGMGQASKILPQEDIKRLFMNGTIDEKTAINLLQTIHGAS